MFEDWRPIVSYLALTRKTEAQRGLLFDVALCDKPNRMGHEQLHNLKMDMDW